MALEDLTGTKYIDSLNSSNPTATDGVSEGDDHIRGIKNVLKTTFPSVSGAVTATHTELNILDGVTATTAELNILDGVTSTTAELNILDGVTATASEINRLDGTIPVVQGNLQIYCGYVDSAASAEIVPSGWSVAKSGTGGYVVTHNLGLSTPASDLIVTATAVNTFTLDVICSVGTLSANSFRVNVYDVSDVGVADRDFHFMAIKRV